MIDKLPLELVHEIVLNDIENVITLSQTCQQLRDGLIEYNKLWQLLCGPLFKHMNIPVDKNCFSINWHNEYWKQMEINRNVEFYLKQANIDANELESNFDRILSYGPRSLVSLKNKAHEFGEQYIADKAIEVIIKRQSIDRFAKLLETENNNTLSLNCLYVALDMSLPIIQTPQKHWAIGDILRLSLKARSKARVKMCQDKNRSKFRVFEALEFCHMWIEEFGPCQMIVHKSSPFWNIYVKVDLDRYVRIGTQGPYVTSEQYLHDTEFMPILSLKELLYSVVNEKEADIYRCIVNHPHMFDRNEQDWSLKYPDQEEECIHSSQDQHSQNVITARQLDNALLPNFNHSLLVNENDENSGKIVTDGRKHYYIVLKTIGEQYEVQSKRGARLTLYKKACSSCSDEDDEHLDFTAKESKKFPEAGQFFCHYNDKKFIIRPRANSTPHIYTL